MEGFDGMSISVIILIVLMAVDKAMGMLKSRGIDLQELSRQIDDLHRWHDIQDEEGVKLWYVRRSLEEAIIKLADNIDLQRQLFEKIDRRLEHIENNLGRDIN